MGTDHCVCSLKHIEPLTNEQKLQCWIQGGLHLGKDPSICNNKDQCSQIELERQIVTLIIWAFKILEHCHPQEKRGMIGFDYSKSPQSSPTWWGDFIVQAFNPAGYDQNERIKTSPLWTMFVDGKWINCRFTILRSFIISVQKFQYFKKKKIHLNPLRR